MASADARPGGGLDAIEDALRPGAGSIVDANRKSLTAIAVAGAYIALAASTGIVLLGIVPATLSLRALGRGEKLAPLAVGAAGLAIFVAVSALSHR
jgi:hypothetical protein